VSGTLVNCTPEQAQAELDRAREKWGETSANAGMTVIPAGEIENHAHEVEQELKRTITVIRTAGIYFAHWVHKYIDDKLWQPLEHASLKEGLAQPEIKVSESHASNLALVYLGRDADPISFIRAVEASVEDRSDAYKYPIFRPAPERWPPPYDHTYDHRAAT
jgi:hypothetical protein